jgi:DNA adenine methylase
MPYYGGKTMHTEWINRYLPRSADAYIEGFAGSAAIGLSRPRADFEVFNDLDPGVANLYRVLQSAPEELQRTLRFTMHSRQEHACCSAAEADRVAGKHIDPVEWARQHLVLVRQPFAGGFDGSWGYARQSRALPFHRVVALIPPVAARMRDAVIENLHFDDLIARYERLGANTLWYLDPPYVPETRVSKKVYRAEMTADEHVLLIKRIKSIRGMVVVSGYPSDLYDRALDGWLRVTKNVVCLASNAAPRAGGCRPRRTECLWINPATYERLKREGRAAA